MIQTLIPRTPRVAGLLNARISLWSLSANSAFSTRTAQFIRSDERLESGGSRFKVTARRHVKKSSGKKLYNYFFRPHLASTFRTCSTIASIADSDMSSAATIIKSVDKYRLPLDVKPTHYDLTVRTDLEKLSFDGFVKIE